MDMSHIGLRPKRFEIGFQNKGENPSIRICILVRYEAWVRETPRSIESCSKAGMILAAVKVVIIA